MTDVSSPFSVLGLPADASPEAIRKAYRKLALRYHPDRNPGDEDAAEAFHAVREAYEALDTADPDAGYDAERVVAEMQQAAAEAARRRGGVAVAGRGWQLARFELDRPRGLRASLAGLLGRGADADHWVETHWQGLRDLRWEVLLGWTEIRGVCEVEGAVELALTSEATARLAQAVPAEAFSAPGVYRLPMPQTAELAAAVRRQVAGAA